MSTIKNAILTRYQGGYRTDTDATSVAANGRRETFLSLTSTANSAATTAAITEYLDTLDSGITTVRAGLLPTSDAETPYAGQWGPGASVTVPRLSNSLTGETMQVRSITVNEDDATGQLSFTPELVRVASTRFQQADGQLRQLNDGTLNGRSAAATIAGDLDPDVRAGRVRTFEQDFSQDTLEVADSGIKYPSDYGRLQSAFVTLKTAGSTATTCVVKIAGFPVTFSQSGGASSTTITIPAGRDAVFGMTTAQVDVTPLYSMQVSTTAVGTGAAGLVVTLVFGER
jgi:hypothetical protein